MKSKKFLTLILISFSICFSTIASLHATVFFEFDGESGYQYMYPNVHPGGGYFAHMGGWAGPGTFECVSTCPTYDQLNACHNTRLSNETAAQGAVSGSLWSIKTPYSGSCTGENTPRDVTKINLAQPLQEYYMRWYQKWTGNWYEADVQQKFFKPNSNESPPTAWPGHLTFNSKGHNRFRAFMPNIDGHFDKNGVTRNTTGVWVTATNLGGEYTGTTSAYDDDPTTTSEFIFQTNTWYCIEIHVKVNTSGNSDGLMETWVNGTKVFGVYNFKWYSGTIYGVNSFELQHIYYNRNAVDEPTYMDNIVISDRYIGPVGVEPAPSPPKGLKIVQ